MLHSCPKCKQIVWGTYWKGDVRVCAKCDTPTESTTLLIEKYYALIDERK